MLNTVIKTIFSIVIASFLITVPAFFIKGMTGTAWSEFLMAMIMTFIVCNIDE